MLKKTFPGPRFSLIQAHSRLPDRPETPMNDETAPRTPPAKPAPAGARKSDPRAAERLAAALRENLRRRKQQAKARRPDVGSAGGQGQD